ncbi:MAG: hypothetical protein Q8M11_22175 [Sulfuritalea sp.]|nr:hypothetical protein [Sulfuritalea sp.]
MSFLKSTFGVQHEARSDEFYRNNRWMGQTPAEARFVSTVRVVLLLITCGVAYYWLS